MSRNTVRNPPMQDIKLDQKPLKQDLITVALPLSLLTNDMVAPAYNDKYHTVNTVP